MSGIPRCFAIVVLAGLAASCAGPRPIVPFPSPAPSEPVSPLRAPVVRVLILETGKAVTIETAGARVIARGASGEKTEEFGISGSFVVAPVGGGLRLRRPGGPVLEAAALEIRPDAEGRFTIDKLAYRGELVLRRGAAAVMAINVLDIDAYLKGVLPSEIGYLSSELGEAYRAQAIASRSYAISKLDEKEGELFDLRATIMDQVYRGIAGEFPPASEAVERTRGMVAVWEGEPVRAYYSACCGGHTADIRVGWPWKTHYPYLEGVRDASDWSAPSYCRDSRHFRWEAGWSGPELSRILNRTLAAELGERFKPFRTLRDISVERYSLSGRAVALTMITDSGSWRVEGDRIRWVLRPESATGPILRSTLFKLEVRRGGGRVASVKVRGAGNGHGTGMCQTGAIGMAAMGMSAEQILRHYYPGIGIERIYR